MADQHHSIKFYQQAIQSGEIPSTYKFLTRYVMQLKASFSRILGAPFTCTNIAPGYMDYTYFYFTNESLKNRKLRFGLVLNHKAMCFELWLLGQNATIQKYYWHLLKHTAWNHGRDVMPQYSIVEIVIVSDPVFSNLTSLTEEIIGKTMPVIKDMVATIESLGSNGT